MAELVYGAPLRALDANGNPVPGAELRAFREGTSTPLTIYADNAGATAHPVPLEADGNGVFPPIFNTSAYRVKIEIRDPVTNALLPGYPIDGALAGQISAQAASGVSFAPTADIPATTVQGAIEQVAADLRSFEFIATADASDDATVNFTSFDAAKYDAYLFVFQGVTPATDSADLYMRTSTNGGGVYDASAGHYSWAYNAASEVSSNTSLGGSAAQIQLANGIGSEATEDGVSGQVWLLGPHLAKNTQVTFHLAGESSGGNFIAFTGMGVRKSSGDVDAVRFLYSSGAVESGTITMYGLRNG